MKSFRLSSIILVTSGLALLLSGCGNQAASPEGKLKVVTTFYPMYEFSKQVAGDHADVVALIPPGVEPHDWEPSAKDMAVLKEANVFVYNGIVEGWVDGALSSSANEQRIVVEASSGITLMEGEEEHEEGESNQHAEANEGPVVTKAHDEAEGHPLDPHVWLDPVLAQQEVSAIEAAMEKADPANKEDYRKNAESYVAKLKELDLAFRDGLQAAKHKEFVTQHAAFGYLAKEYGLTQIPIAGLSPEQEPSPEEMAKVVEFAREHGVKTIFFETLVEPKVARVVADEIGAATDVLNPLEGLTDEEKQNNLDYIGVMKNNLAALQKALNE
ncbi:metal ABC transporter substrate-binding protein [Paenibacillus sacheonensis]|uniref:Zinc ABC transporter solute-binding protein n=1 Tax=Paenibacillus sacheonensis TaxID=742054 RepID=A0A7X4YN52_9BACL|nr:metal ABC transporter substrate-binding protein [Paenibacillus sacheonensis]MBM7564883.1 zinc transport system substrate-binding protein [Paenibacillus sacheonensis]NBC69431.1 zinc ABC transporter solute-binding protein [Paenibacillus sacheonensis]